MDDQSGLPDRAKLAIQMNHFDRMMDIAKREKLRRIVFIHGVGQGVLRHQIRTSLEQHHPDCSYREGDPRRYGSGATEVWLGQASWRKPERPRVILSPRPCFSLRRLPVGRAVRVRLR